MNGAEPQVNDLIGRTNQLVRTLINESGVGPSLLPTYPLAATARQVQANRINHATGEVDDVTTIPLTEVAASFVLDWQQLTDLPQAIDRAKQAIRTYSRLQDRLLFLGYAAGPPATLGGGAMPAGTWVNRGTTNDGLLEATTLVWDGASIFDGIAAAQGMLEDSGQSKPVAIAMGTDLADRVGQREAGFADTLRQRIEDLLGSMIRRVPILPPRTAILVSEPKRSGSDTEANDGQERTTNGTPPDGAVDRAVAVDPRVRQLDTDNQGRYRFAVYGVLALRIKDPAGVIVLNFM